MKKKRCLLLVVAGITAVLLAACQPQTVEVTRVVTETEVVQGETVEVTRVVTETETVTEQVEVTRVVESPTARGEGGTLSIIYWQAASTLNPYLSGGTKDTDAATLVLEPLARYDETGALIPWLAEELPTVENGGISEDLMSITWKLRQGIIWSDGTPLTAEDVVFTGEYCMHPDAGCSQLTQFQDVASVEAIDATTVRVNFSVPKPYPYGPFVSSLVPILQKAQFENCLGVNAQNCNDENFAPIGTGPFVVTEFRPNDVALFTVNDSYRDPNKPYFAEVFLKGGGDAASAARSVLEVGEADYAWNLQIEPEVLRSMELAGQGKVVAAFAGNVERILINLTNPDPALGEQRSEWTADNANPHPFLTDPAVRQALSLAIDRNTIASHLYGSAGQATCNVLPAPAVYVSTANDGCLTQDIEAANQLLDEAGWVLGADGVRAKDGVRLSMLYQTSTNSVRQSTQALVKQWWEAIGVETELRSIDAAVFFGGDPASPDTYGKFFADVEMFTNGASSPDPETYMGNWRCSEIARTENNWLGNNIPRFCSEAYDALAGQMAETAVLEDRAELAKQMNDILVQEYVLLPLVHRGSVSAHSNSLLGVRINGWDSELWNIADWTRASN